MNFSRLFIDRPIGTILLMAAILLVGFVAFEQLPISALPEVSYPTIQVQTFYPGASPVVMSSTVTGPLEKQLGQIQGLTQMTSNSAGGASIIVLQFALNVNIDVAEQEVQAAINAANTYLPNDLPMPPTYSKINPADAPVLTLALTSNAKSLSEIEDLADTRLAPKISQLSGVGLVTVQGGQKPAIRIQANQIALASYGITLEQVRTAITNNTVTGAKGVLDGPHQAYTIDANDQLSSADQYKQVVVAYRNGAAILLTDVAKIINGVEDAKLAAWMNTDPAIILNVRRQSDANTIKVVDSIKALLPQLQASLPASVHVQILTDRTVTVRASVEDVEFELLLTIGLVVAVMYLFLRSWRSTVIPAVAVPLSIVGSFAVMYALGYSLNNLTLMALTVSTGFVVDDAIVMVENISRYIEAGMSPLKAAIKGAGEIGFTILSLTISLIAVLIPLLFMGDITGRLFREFAVTLAVTIAISAVVSLTLTPMMSSRLLRHVPAEREGKFYRWSENFFEKSIALYGRTLSWALGRQPLVLLVAVATLVTAVGLYYWIPKEFFPSQDTGVLQIVTQAPESTSFQAMVIRQQAVARVVLDDPAVASLSSFVGVDSTNTTLNTGRMQVDLLPLEKRGISAEKIIQRLRPRLSQIAGIKAYLQPVQDLTVEDRVSRTQYQYTLEDTDEKELGEWVARVVEKLKTLPELQDVVTDQQPNGSSIALTIDRISASRLGVTPQALDDTLYDAFGQRQVSNLYTQTNQYHVILEADPRTQSSPERLNDIYLQGTSTSTTSASSSGAGGGGASSGPSLLSAGSTSGVAAVSSSTLSSNTSTLGSTGTSTALSSSSTGSVLQTSATSGNSASTGGTSVTSSTTGSGGGGGSSATNSTTNGSIPLAAFTTMTRSSTPLTINRQSQFPTVTISFNLAPGVHLGPAVDAVNKAIDSLQLPINVRGKFQGTAASFQNSLANEGLLVLAALVTVYIVLGVLYESFIHPVTILSTLPSAGVGALLTLQLFDQGLGIVGVIGIVLLIGIVKKNGIMMVDFALQAERTEGKTPQDAIYSASLLRFRPILMTTMAALLGGLPLALGQGIGSELRRPLGLAMVGGLLLSQVLTLYTTPVIYLWFDRLNRRFRRTATMETTPPWPGTTAEEL